MGSFKSAYYLLPLSDLSTSFILEKIEVAALVVETIVKLHFLRNLESNTVVLAMNTVYLCKRELPA